MEMPYLCLQGFQGITSFLEEAEYYDLNTYDLDNDTEEDTRFLFIYGFISVLVFFIVLCFLTACYYHFKNLSSTSSDSSDSSEDEGIDARSNAEQSIGTDNTSTCEENKISNESLHNTNEGMQSCAQECIPKTKNVKIRDSAQFVRESDYFQRIFSGQITSPFSRQNASNTSSKRSKIYPSKTISSSDNSKKNYLGCAHNLNQHAECGVNDSSVASGGSCKYHNLPLAEGGTSRVSLDEYCNISFEENNDSQSSSSDMDISALFLSSEDISTHTSITELVPILTDADINETYSETVTTHI